MRTVAFVRGADRGDEHDQDMSLRPPENTLYSPIHREAARQTADGNADGV